MTAVDVRADFGAVGDGSTDDTAAIRAAIAQLPNTGSAGTSGGVVMFPPGSYRVTSPLVLDGLYNITLQGSGSQWGGCRLLADASAAPVISGKPTGALRIRDLAIHTVDTAYTGPMVDLGVTTGSSASGLFGLESVFFYAPAQASSGVVFVALKNAVTGFVRDCFFQGGGEAVHGRDAAGEYANAVTISGCTFTRQDRDPIRNLYSGCVVQACSFEPLRSGNAGGVRTDPGLPFESFVFTGNWLGDVNPATPFGRWMSVSGTGIAVVGNMFDSGDTGFWLNGPASGLQITGNRFANITNGVDRGGQQCDMALIAGNTFVSVIHQQVGGNIGFGPGPSLVLNGKRPVVAGARGGNAALGSLLTTLAQMGLITNSTTA